jgi:hypothetical protein
VEAQLAKKLRSAVRLVHTLLAERNYVGLSDLSTPGPEHLDADDIERTIGNYAGTVRMPSETELTFDAIEVNRSIPRTFSVDAPLFTIEEGRSDLTARIIVIVGPGDDFQLIYYDAWVM